MKLLRIVVVLAVASAAVSALGGKPSSSRPRKRELSKEATDSLRETFTRLRFAPMWTNVPKFLPDPKSKPEPVPVAAYAVIWQREWQAELRLTPEQRTSLAVIRAKATAESEQQTQDFQELSSEERKAKVKSWGGKPSPERQALEKETRHAIEAILTPEQLQTIRDYVFPERVVNLLYDASVRREIDFSPEQEARFRRIAKEKLAGVQEMSLEQAEKLWAMLTPEQQESFQEIAKHQGPTSATLSIAWELGFDFSSAVPGHPMLGEAPVRKRLKLNPEQEKQIDDITAEAAKRQRAREERMAGDTPSEAEPDWTWETDAQKRVEAILTPEQLATLNEIDLRRRVTLAFGYPEKRKEAGVTERQFDAYKRLVRQAHKPMYNLDRAMLARAVDILTPAQKEKMRAVIKERLGW
jgi:Spy/CpxP family protein refolding chaperone